jgi:hypothetical protein
LDPEVTAESTVRASTFFFKEKSGRLSHLCHYHICGISVCIH